MASWILPLPRLVGVSLGSWPAAYVLVSWTLSLPRPAPAEIDEVFADSGLRTTPVWEAS